MSEKIYLNGGLVSGGEARVSVSNPAFLHGVGLFETLRTYNGRPFMLAEHIERLRRSAARLNMPIGETLEKVPAAVADVIEANNLTGARVRFTVTPPGAPESPDDVTLLVRAEATTGYPPELYERGMTVCVLNEFRQSKLDPLAGHKTTSYFPRLLALRNAQDKRCGEALWFTPDSLLAESCMANVFLVIKDGLVTPPIDTPILPGVTRSAVLDLARRQGIACEERPCTIDDLLGAREVFLTNAIMEVMPVTRIERHAVSQEKVGPITQSLGDAYRELTGRA